MISFQNLGRVNITSIQALTLIPPLVATLTEDTTLRSIILVTCIATAIIIENLFALMRKQNMSLNGLTTALIGTILVPINLPIWQLVLVLALGVILGDLIFGKRGFSFLNSATVTLSLLVFSFPHVQLAAPTQLVAMSTLPGTVLLLFLGLISWRVVIGTIIAILVFLTFRGVEVDFLELFAVLIFGLIFLISDPFSAASTNPGRWLYGLLVGGLIGLFSTGVEFIIQPEAIVFAALLGSIFAPLLDHLVVLGQTARRAEHHV
jgi:Na+-transporting NADH:ubiquinone oxidoreductase subunit B